MSALRHWPRVVALLLSLSLSAYALATDQEIDELFSSARMQDLSARGTERSQTVDRIRSALRGRIAADSSTGTALERLERLDAFSKEVDARRLHDLATLRALASKPDTTATRIAYERALARFPDSKFPTLASLSSSPHRVDTVPIPPPPVLPAVDSCSRTDRPGRCADSPATRTAAPAPTPAPTLETPPAPRCPDGAPSVAFVAPDPGREVPITDSAISLRVRLSAPCPLRSIEIRRDSALVRSVDLPQVRVGDFEIEDQILLDQDVKAVFLIACDTFQTCSSATLRTRRSATIPPWIPWTSGGIVLLGLLTGIIALFRRPNGASQPGGARNGSSAAKGFVVRSPKQAPSPDSGDQTDIQQTLRRIILASEKELARGPRLVSRMNTAIPSLEADPVVLERAFSSLLKLPVARAGLRGTVLVATGRGPVNMEVVLEDNGPDLDDSVVKQLFDPGIARLRERQGLDKELSEAATVLSRLHGHLSAENRIDGGLRLRIRLPLASAAGPRAASLLK